MNTRAALAHQEKVWFYPAFSPRTKPLTARPTSPNTLPTHLFPTQNIGWKINMSSFEIAGVVLAAFPILFETAGDLRKIFGDLQTWWRFETEFEDFVFALEREHIAFSQNLQILLTPLEIDEETKERLLDDRNRALWHEPLVQSELKRTIQPRYYGWFIKEMNNISAALTGLHSLLRIDRVGATKPSLNNLTTQYLTC
jgi:hypothetical protein